MSKPYDTSAFAVIMHSQELESFASSLTGEVKILAGKYTNAKDNLYKLLDASKQLRKAQKRYMADRGNEELGKAVGIKASELDDVIKEITEELEDV